ncbi:hypothetical protein JTB14_034953 [Gonioctena quinquepunctata]|nr:hypothetical protein JTB14_034953 [Gonioctena quinquepunctata]
MLASSIFFRPNVCRSRTRTYCCPGWQRHNILGLCILPVCSRQCGQGQCVSPNVCLCEGGQRSSACGQSFKQIQGIDGKSCRAICMNGGTCVEGKCVCPEGYSGEFCTERNSSNYSCDLF